VHDHPSSNVSVDVGAAIAEVPTFVERFCDDAALRAGLGSTSRIDTDKLDTLLIALAANQTTNDNMLLSLISDFLKPARARSFQRFG
jgi:hypothetical protein